MNISVTEFCWHLHVRSLHCDFSFNLCLESICSCLKFMYYWRFGKHLMETFALQLLMMVWYIKCWCTCEKRGLLNTCIMWTGWCVRNLLGLSLFCHNLHNPLFRSLFRRASLLNLKLKYCIIPVDWHTVYTKETKHGYLFLQCYAVIWFFEWTMVVLEVVHIGPLLVLFSITPSLT